MIRLPIVSAQADPQSLKDDVTPVPIPFAQDEIGDSRHISRGDPDG